MVLPQEKLAQLREALDKAENPLFIHDDDPDGLCAYLLFYRYAKKGKGLPVKSVPVVDTKFLRKVQETNPDAIFILDMPLVEQDFLDQVHCPVHWLDHHPLQQREKVSYYNPLKYNPKDNSSTTVNAYHVVKQDLWIAMIGAVGDWQLPDFAEEFRKKYPDLLPAEINKPENALFDSQLGILIKVISFLLKGEMSDVKKGINVMLKINSPYEILKQETPQGRYLWKLYQHTNKKYEELLSQAKKQQPQKGIRLFTYPGSRTSFTKELSNELLYTYPDEVIIIGRLKSGEYRLSLRAGKIIIRDALEKALMGIEGSGGGHEHACGANVKEEDFDRFLSNLQQSIS